jgi:N-methylhydantoinase A/oxoprolinase/acetone carboxylase beta subunit
MTAQHWEFWIDVGGTFTDCLARSPSGQITQHKLLSSGATKGRIGELADMPAARITRRRAREDRSMFNERGACHD